MAMKKYNWQGIGDVWLPDWIQVEVKLIKNSRFYSNIRSVDQTKDTWHDTGNPNTNADQEWTWANNGRQGAGVGGYNGIFDDKKLIITQMFDTVVWAAGTNVGNVTSYHFEQAWGGSVNFQKSLEVGAAVHGAIIAAKGWDVDKALVQHNYWYGKDCPGQIRRRGLWPQVVRMVKEAAAQSRAAAGGSAVAEEVKTYPKPVYLEELSAYKDADRDTIPSVVSLSDGTKAFYVSDIVEAVRATRRRRYANINSEALNVDIEAGEQFSVDWIFIADDGNPYFYTKWGTRVLVSDTKRIKDVVTG